MGRILLAVMSALLLAASGCQSATQPSEPPASMSGAEAVVPTAIFSTTQVTAVAIPNTAPSKASECPQMESRLYDLTTATDPAAFAQSHGLYYGDGRTRVVVVLVAPEAGTSILTQYDAQVETRYESLVQVLVPPAELCDLSNDPQVQFVRAPRVAEPSPND